MPNNIFTRIGFHPVIQQWFKARFAAPSPPQEQGWPSIAERKHTLILAPTGSGKTLAAFLWSIDQLFRQSVQSDAKAFAKIVLKSVKSTARLQQNTISPNCLLKSGMRKKGIG